jgi:hypothetical protein
LIKSYVQRSNFPSQNCGTAFVTFRRRTDATRFLNLWHDGKLLALEQRLADPELHEFDIREAPNPRDLLWSKLSVTRRWHRFMVFSLNAVLVVFLVAIILPMALMTTLKSLRSVREINLALVRRAQRKGEDGR